LAPIRASGAGQVIASKTSRYAVGDIVFGMTNWQEYLRRGRREASCSVVPKGMGLDLATVMNVLGADGKSPRSSDFSMLASFKKVTLRWFRVPLEPPDRLSDRSPGPKAPRRWSASPAARKSVPKSSSATASMQCLDYREPHLARRLRASCPEGINLYFDNVGGEILDDVLTNIAMNARIVLCGAIAQYNETSPTSGLKNHTMLIMRRGRMEGFIVLDYAHRFAEAQMELAGMVLSGALRHQEHIVEGLENAPTALNLLFTGGNHGKTLVLVDPSVTLD
jgi:NADPH-dependent curcumin reductase CurA